MKKRKGEGKVKENNTGLRYADEGEERKNAVMTLRRKRRKYIGVYDIKMEEKKKNIGDDDQKDEEGRKIISDYDIKKKEKKKI